MYWSPVVEGINKLKPESGNRVRFTKPYRVEDVKPQILLVGNSRIEMGLAAESDYFAKKSVYNLGMPGVGLQRQMQNAAQQIQDNPNLELVILSLDYLDFTYSKENWSDKLTEAQQIDRLLGSQQTVLSVLKTFLGYFLSLDTLFNSFATAAQQRGEHNSITVYGTNEADSYLGVMRYEGIKPLFVQKIDQIKQTLTRQQNYFLAEGQTHNPGILQLLQLVNLAKQKGVRLVTFISPYHYSYLHILNDHARWSDYLNWKKALTLALSNENFNIELWDFSGFNTYTLEPVVFDQPHRLMSWYWEPSHYRVELGEKMLPVLLNEQPAATIARRMTPQSIDGFIAADEQGLADSKAQWQALVEFLYGN